MKKIWTNGCFDVIHRGHIESLKFAKSLGDYLVVGLDEDEKIKADKGQSRPFNTLEDRMEILKSIKYVDEVIPFKTDKQMEDIVKSISPAFFVKGSEYQGKKVVAMEYAEAMVYFDRIEGYSTTNILKKYERGE
jgi:D-beta-D-heptose 7-phosphate kinase/D-beta-D-heptose 1-phosphate adenosyltransferase